MAFSWANLSHSAVAPDSCSLEKLALLEIDRERMAQTRLQKALEAERNARTSEIKRLRADHNAALATIGRLREQVDSLKYAVDTHGNERDRERAELQPVRTQLEVAIRQAAADSARADELRNELERYRSAGKSRTGSGGARIPPPAIDARGAFELEGIQAVGGTRPSIGAHLHVGSARHPLVLLRRPSPFP
jgi:hypothetical protein